MIKMFLSNGLTKHLLLSSAMVMAMLSGCSKDETVAVSKARIAYGPQVSIGNGTGRSWVQINDEGNPASIGFTLTATALDNLPTNPFPPTEYFMSLPADAKNTAYDHIGLDWGPMGHEPIGTYDLPHFDAHFYHIDTNTRATISPADSLKGTKMPAADNIPTGYIFPGPLTAAAIVPRMGVHFIDPTSHEHQPGGKKFDQTMIFGFWDGKMIFTEPMFTREYLLSKPNFSGTLPQPKAYPKSGVYYATRYSIRYNSATNDYTISLDGLTKR